MQLQDDDDALLSFENKLWFVILLKTSHNFLLIVLG